MTASARDTIHDASEFSPAPANDDGKGPSQRDRLIAIAIAATLWRDADYVSYASVLVDGHLEHHRIKSPGFKR